MDARVVVLALALAAVPAAADVRVQQQDGGLLSVQASGAPVSEVLDRLARQTGMQIVYEGAPPRLPVTLSIEHRTPAEAVFSLLEGLGLNYALRLDESGGRVLTLVMAGAAGQATPAGGAPGAQPPGATKLPPPYPPPPSYPQEPSEDDYVDPQAGIIPPPPPQPPQEFTITPPQQQQKQEAEQPAAQPSLGSGFSSPFSSGGFSTPPVFGNTPPPSTGGPAPPAPFPGEPPPEEKEP